MRITTQMAYQTVYAQLNKRLEQYRELQEEITTGKSLNNASDDPTGTVMYMRYSADLAANQRYQDNMDDAEQYLTAAEQSLSEISDLLAQAREVAELNATGTANATTYAVGSDEVGGMIEQMFQALNTKQNNRYLFSGYNTNEQAYLNYGRILPGYASSANTYEGTMTTSGEFTGTSEKEYLVRIISGGDVGTAQYQVSEDGGATWGSQLTLSSTISVYDDVNGEDLGVQASFTDGTFAEGDEFKLYVRSGAYNGDDGEIEFNMSKSTRIISNFTGQEVAEDTGLIDTMYNLKIALENGDSDAIAKALEDLEAVQDTFENTLAAAGTRLNRIEVARNNLVSVETNLTSNIENVSETDLVDAISQLSLLETALSTTTSMLSSVLSESLLNYL